MKSKTLWYRIFCISAIALFGTMCAVVSANYVYLKMCPGCSASAYVAFFYAIPFALGILICLIAAAAVKKK